MNLIKTNETGRSTVEMLGVLAVMGVLSVTGVAGYTVAMNRHRSNELLNAVSMRATALASQRMMGKSLSLGGFTDNQRGTSVIDVNGATTDGIEITITNVPVAVCKNLYNTKGANVVQMKSNNVVLTAASGCVDGKTVSIKFNNDLSTGSNGTETPQTVSCSSNTQCTAANTFCKMTSASEGTCEPISHYSGSNPSYSSIYARISSTKMNFWSARNWCAAQGLYLVGPDGGCSCPNIYASDNISHKIIQEVFGIKTAYASGFSCDDEYCVIHPFWSFISSTEGALCVYDGGYTVCSSSSLTTEGYAICQS